MICSACGKTIPEGSVNCPECGAVVSAPAAAPVQAAAPVFVAPAAPVAAPVFIDPSAAPVSAVGMKFKDFIKLPENKKLKSSITSCSVVLYICGALSAVLALLVPGMGASIVDALLVIALGVWLHVSKSRVPAVITLVYSIINVLYMLVATGKLGGWLILIAGIYAVIGTFKAKKAFKNAGGTK